MLFFLTDRGLTTFHKPTVFSQFCLDHVGPKISAKTILAVSNPCAYITHTLGIFRQRYTVSDCSHSGD